MMADFCVQCAQQYGFPTTDYPKRETQPGCGWPELCEGCGPTLVDGEGRCMGGCLKYEHGGEEL
jgi:hypothetical protein